MTLAKSLVFCLALANVGYFLWVRGIGKPPELALSAPRAPSLRLASESHDGALVEIPSLTSAPSPKPAHPPILAAAAAPLPELLTNVKRCVSVGPFRDVSEAAHAAATLRAGKYDPRQRVAEGEVWAGVWVYLPLPSTRAGGEQMLVKLKASGIDDALEMPGPGDSSVVSLGLYSEPKRAQMRVAQAQSLGFNPLIVDRKRSGDVYWIDVDLKPTDGLLNPAQLQGPKGRILRLEVKACPAALARSP